MDIFETDRARIKRRLQAILPILLLAAVCLIFYLGITGAGKEAVTKEQTTLKRALEQGAIHTYALTGNYPQNLEELLLWPISPFPFTYAFIRSQSLQRFCCRQSEK